ncbi:Rough colony protein B, tight adherence-tad-subunit [Pasteurella testudinis DSM 23072]|uniref:Rough colony protein B, tight adherence-tad-subunit n=1 Tax=Pasteurella testudinis DSM 23072 TaxID=1122938 RepID=A0A1W1UD18_9PAST|nr:hypothetical protein [Pasteurella testudinis]SMB78959.1 Rough colony protein B, tight adherence-tad-subunit [Pasteurella testudinis DSM 23072]SUB52452.1 putative tight adherance operon protein [Pasteurella testudinis]
MNMDITKTNRLMRLSAVAFIFALFIFWSLPASAVSGAFAKNSAVEPTRSDLYAGERLRIQHYVPINNSDAELRNVVNRVVRDLGSRSDKQVYIVWTDAKSRKLANILKKAFVKKHVADKQVIVAKSQYRRDIYPLYVEIHGFDAAKHTCRLRSAERHFYSEPHEFCAENNNYRVQLNNPTAYR